MGKPFANELVLLSETYDWARRFPIQPLSSALLRSRFPLVAVGSGGSFTTAHLAASLHEERFGLPAAAATPLEIASTGIDLREAAVLLLTAGGKNPDILGAFDAAVRREPRRLTVICATTGSALARRVNRYSTVELCEFALPAGRDGFLATNSLLASGVLLYRAYEAVGSDPSTLPGSFESLVGEKERGHDYSPVLEADTLLVLHPPSLKTVAVEIESKFTEAALGHVQIADYRQFAHGRHHWLAKRGDRSAVLALATASTADVMDKTLDLIPKQTPAVRLVLPHEGPLACLAGIVLGFDLTRQAGEARGIDPGDPGVPAFGRKLYNLGVFSRAAPAASGTLADPDVAIARKARGTEQVQARQPSAWEQAHADFLDRIRQARVRAIVADYDGTLCDEARRFDPLPTPIAAELTRLLRAGVVLGVATGRGKSVRERLQGAIPRTLWDRVVVGYYNGGDVAPLGDDGRPDGTEDVSETLRGVAALLEQHSEFLGVSVTERRRKQVTLKPGASQSLERLWQNVQGLIRPSAFPGVSVLRSGHSIDVLAPGVSKLAVLDRVVDMTGTPADGVLCIGDQGCWPGNDHELLATPLSLSVNVTSVDPARCWNLAPVGLRESQAALGYLKLLKSSTRGARFALPVARRKRA